MTKAKVSDSLIQVAKAKEQAAKTEEMMRQMEVLERLKLLLVDNKSIFNL